MKKSILAVIVASILTLTMCLAACTDNKNNSSDSTTAKTLTDIEIVSNPTKLVYEEGEVLDLTGLKVNAVYSNGTKEDVTSKITTNLGNKELKSANKSFFIIYKETIDGKTVTKNKSISITVKAEEVITPTRTVDFVPSAEDLPHNAIKTSTAENVFYTYYDSSSMKSEAYLELNSDATDKTKGTFTFVEMVGHVDNVENYKMCKIIGDYKTDGEKMTLQARELHLVKDLNSESADAANSGKWDKATKEVAAIVKSGDKITGLNFGKMSGTETFWGWSKSKASSFTEGLATSYNLGADEVYMAAVDNHALSENMKSYYVPASVSIRGIDEILGDKTYYVGDKLVLPAKLVALVTYIVPEGSDTTQTKNYVNCPLAGGYTVAIKRGDTTVDITSALEEGDKMVITVDGVTGEFPITVKPVPAVKTLTALEIKTAPAKTTYRMGEKFDPTGIVVTAKYSTGSADDVTVSDVEKLNFTIDEKAYNSVLLAENTNVTVSYTEGETTVKTTQAITVNYVEPWEIAKTSKADKIFVVSKAAKQSKQYAYVVVELYGDMTSGTYIATARFTTSNWTNGNNATAVYAGSYTVAGGKITFGDPTDVLLKISKATTTFFFNPAKSSEEDKATVAANGFVATINETDGKLTGITFAQTEGFSSQMFGFAMKTPAPQTLELIENNTLTAQMESDIPTLG